MIAYFDTSALVPLLVEESGSSTAARVWDEAEHVVSVRLIYAEARAALAQVRRTGRITDTQLATLVTELGSLYDQLDRLQITESLVRRAGELAQNFDLRGYDAVHLAATELLADAQTVLVAGDRELREAGTQLGISVADTSRPS